MTPLPASARFVMGTPNVVGAAGLRASLSLLLELGVSRIDAYVTALVSYAMARLMDHGYQILTPNSHAGILTFRAAETDVQTDALVKALAERKIYVVKHWDALKNAYLRASFHCYNNLEDVDRLLSALEEIKL